MVLCSRIAITIENKIKIIELAILITLFDNCFILLQKESFNNNFIATIVKKYGKNMIKGNIPLKSTSSMYK